MEVRCANWCSRSRNDVGVKRAQEVDVSSGTDEGILLWPLTPDSRLPRGNDGLVLPLVLARAFDPGECHTLRDLHRNKAANRSSLLIPIEDYRHAETWYLEPDDMSWAFDRLVHLAVKANHRFCLDLAGICESLLLVRYLEGGHFSWHTDTGVGVTSTRKISISIQLSEPKDYEGGALEFSGLGEPSLARGLGTAIAFPSFFSHRVQPVSRGERWSLVGWIHGPAFR